MPTENPLIRHLQRDGSKIAVQARGGDPEAQRVIDLYRLCYSCPADRVAWALLAEAYRDWQKREDGEHGAKADVP